MKKLYPLYIFSALLSILFFSQHANSAEPNIIYTVSMPFPSNHLFDVSIEIRDYTGSDNYIDISLPAWRSGRYVILNPSSGVQEFSAVNEIGETLKWNKTDKDTW
ncbi:MAG: hypothetical protein ABI462_10495, partial [Ignavibacteria bacterium]